MIDSTAIQLRAAERAELEAMTAAFLADAGRIQQLTHIERAPDKPPSWNGSIAAPKSLARRAYLELERQVAEHGQALAATGLTVEQALKQLRKRWARQMNLNVPRLEQIAARYGYAYEATGRGRP